VTRDYRLRYVVPDLPRADDVIPFLHRMDDVRWYSNFGPLEQQFREELATAFFRGLEARHIVTASSGALAIETALIAHGFPAGARVLMPSYTFVATASAVIRAGYVPIFADIDPSTLILDPERAGHLARVLGCSAVVSVGVAGMAVPIGSWGAFAEETGIAVIIDAAAGLGNQETSGSVTLAFSLHATKPFGIGEGGLVVSLRDEIIARARAATNFGLDRGRGVICGTNAKMSEYHSAVGIAQVRRRKEITERRRLILGAYRDAIERSPSRIRILTPV
jgi:dTDP-4-amino-4,6-dideoxygalactose transaminase